MVDHRVCETLADIRICGIAHLSSNACRIAFSSHVNRGVVCFGVASASVGAGCVVCSLIMMALFCWCGCLCGGGDLPESIGTPLLRGSSPRPLATSEKGAIEAGREVECLVNLDIAESLTLGILLRASGATCATVGSDVMAESKEVAHGHGEKSHEGRCRLLDWSYCRNGQQHYGQQEV
jgi:hypothetical protein